MVIQDSRYFVRAFNSIKEYLPNELRYDGAYHHDLKKNIKSDLAEMKTIELDSPKKVNKLIYFSLISRLQRILGQVLKLNELSLNMENFQ